MGRVCYNKNQPWSKFYKLEIYNGHLYYQSSGTFKPLTILRADDGKLKCCYIEYSIMWWLYPSMLRCCLFVWVVGKQHTINDDVRRTDECNCETLMLTHALRFIPFVFSFSDLFSPSCWFNNILHWWKYTPELAQQVLHQTNLGNINKYVLPQAVSCQGPLLWFLLWLCGSYLITAACLYRGQTNV